MPLCPSLLLMVWDTGSKIQGHRTEQSTHCALDWHIRDTEAGCGAIFYELWKEADEGGASLLLLPAPASDQLHNLLHHPDTTCALKNSTSSSSILGKMHQLVAFCIFGGIGVCCAVAELSRFSICLNLCGKTNFDL